MKVLVFTDAGEEIDDELALWYLYPRRKLTIIFCGPDSKTQQERLSNWEKKYHKNLNQIHFMCTLSQYAKVHSKHHYDVILQISPLFGFDSEIITANKYILMGSVDNSVNCPKGSVDLFRRFQSTATVIESAVAAQMRPTKEIMEQIPDYFKEQMYKVGFRLLMVRCDPSKVYAEGLINPDVGRGANFYTVENLFKIVVGDPTKDFVWREDAENYINSFVSLKSRVHTEIWIFIMYRQLDKIFDMSVPIVTEKDYDWYIQSKQGEICFEKFRNIAIDHPEVLNPLYDLYAAWKLVNPDRDDFLSSTNNELDGHK